MARIPMGNFGQGATTAPLQRTRIAGGDDPVARAVGQLADVMGGGAARAIEIERQNREGLARAKAANSSLDYEISVNDAALQLQQEVESGIVPYQESERHYSDRLAQIEVPTVQDLPPDMQVAYEGGIKRTQRAGQLTVARAALSARHADFKGQFVAALDKLGKIAGMPNADIDGINERAAAFAPLARQAGLDDAQVTKALQDFKDKTWTSHATQAVIFNRNDPAQLKKLEQDLSAQDGYYADKLDPEKRNALLSQVVTRQQTLADKAEHAQDRLDAKGERAISQIEQQIASTIPATPEQWTAWAGAVQGTSSLDTYNELVKQEKQVQEVLRLAPDQQQNFLQEAEAKLRGQGGSVRDKANLDRMKTAVEYNLKQLDDAPLLFNANREGDQVEALKLEALVSPADAWEVGAQLQTRASTITAMRKRYGQQVPMRLLLPQEVKVLGETLTKATPTQQVALLGQLRTSTMDDKVYNDVLKQLAPEQPVVAYAGMLAARERATVTLEKHFFSPNAKAGARDVAATMLEGNRLLQGKGDTKFPLPPDKDFRQTFTDETGALFAGRPGAGEVAMQAVRAYYTGKSAADGDSSGEVDPKRMREAIRASLGEVADVNGNGEVLAPWGMSAATFEERAEQAFATAAKAAGLPQSTVDNFGAFGLRQAGERQFYVTNGISYLYGKDGKPLLLSIDGGTGP